MMSLVYQLLKYPYIINQHALREYRAAVWVARPVAANGHVENKEEGCIKGVIARYRRLANGFKHLVVNQPLNVVLGPNQAEYVVLIVKVLAVGQAERARTLLALGCTSWAPVDGTMRGSRLMSYQLHDVDFATFRPGYLVKI